MKIVIESIAAPAGDTYIQRFVGPTLTVKDTDKRGFSFRFANQADELPNRQGENRAYYITYDKCTYKEI